MSKIFKAFNINVDQNNKVFIKTEKMIPQKFNENEFHPESATVHDIKNMLIEAQKTADDIVSKAHQKAESIITEANEEKIHIFEDSKKSGYKDGLEMGKEAGVKAGADTYQALIKEAEQELEETKIQRSKILEKCENEIVELIIEMLKNLSYNAINIKPEIILMLIKRGLSNATINNKVSIKLSEFDYDFILSKKDEFDKYVDSSKEIEILKDFSLNKNDCLLETEFGNIDCGLDQQLDSLTESLVYILNEIGDKN